MTDIISILEDIIAQRRKASPDASYVAKLASKGRAEIAKKLGEEAVETVIASMTGSKEDMIAESADLLFHHLMLLADMNIEFADICAELERREGVSGIVEKANRPK